MSSRLLRLCPVLIIFLSLLSLALPAQAEMSSPSYGIRTDIIASGGKVSHSPRFSVRDCFAQSTPVQEAQSTNYAIRSGFLHLVPITAVPNPTVTNLGLVLEQNYPNPFNPTTTIKYTLEEDCWVSMDIFDISGRKVAVLVQGQQQAGDKTVVWDSAGLPSGTYFCRLQAGELISRMKMIILK